MLDQISIDNVMDSRVSEDIGKPLYNSYCFSNIPQLIEHTLVGTPDPAMPLTVLDGLPRRYDKVVLILIDGFGWSFFEQFSGPFLSRMLDEGVVSMLTTQFPSTTAAHLTTLHSELDVGQTGVFEWFYYEPLVDKIFAPLPFSIFGPKDESSKLDPKLSETLLPNGKLYADLTDQGVRCFAFQNQRIAKSPFSQRMLAGVDVIPFQTVPEALVNLVERVQQVKGKAYFTVYIDEIDKICHRYGPHSPQLESEIRSLFDIFDRILTEETLGSFENTLLLITADHGQTAVYPDRIFYIDREIPQISHWLRTSADGRPLVPAGSPRDMFLYVKENYLTETLETLEESLCGKATVWLTQKLLDEGYFGKNVSERLLDRLGEIVILPNLGEMVWWHGSGRFAVKKRGHHGGLSADEMETVLMARACKA